MNGLSLFNGCGGGISGAELAGIKVDQWYSSEIDKWANIVNQKNYPDTIQLGDVSKWKTWNLPKIDFIIAGFPCQPYSVAGKRKGLDDKRGGNLVNSMVNVIRETQPVLFLLENVIGLLSVGEGTVFKQILKQLNNIGYAVDWITINSSLVSAQSRNRLYIVGKRLDECKESSYTILVGRNNKRTTQLSVFGDK